MNPPPSGVPTSNWSYPTTIRFGCGRASEIADACSSLGMKRPLIVTDPGLAALDIVGDRTEELRAAGLGVGSFIGVQPNPPGSNVDEGVAALRTGEHDGVVAIGGGSALDVGKAVAFMAGQARPIWDFEDIGDNWTRADTEGVLPIVALPTTAGTGSEVGRCSVVTDESHTKRIIFHPQILPSVVICDPELTVGLPAHLTAAVGMDALSHNLEAYCASGHHPMADGIATEGMALVRRALERAVTDGTDIEARADMMCAALMGAVAFQKGLGLMHALSHPVSAAFDTHHGLTNGVLMPFVLEWNAAVIEERLAALARHLDLPGTGASAVIDWVLRLRDSIGIPHGLSALRVPADAVDDLAPRALVDLSGGGNPRPYDLDAVSSLYRRALSG